jgi:hypothetical protein
VNDTQREIAARLALDEAEKDEILRFIVDEQNQDELVDALFAGAHATANAIMKGLTREQAREMLGPYPLHYIVGQRIVLQAYADGKDLTVPDRF